MIRFKVIVIDDDGNTAEAESMDPYSAVHAAYHAFMYDRSRSDGKPVADPWMDFLLTLPDDLKLSEHIGAVMSDFSGKSPTPHARQAFVDELKARIRKHSGPTR